MKKKLPTVILLVCLVLYRLPVQAEFAPLCVTAAEMQSSGALCSMTLSAALLSMDPFPRERVALFNRILEHIRLELLLSGDEQNGRTDVSLHIGRNTPIQWSEVRSGASVTLYSNLFPKNAVKFGGKAPALWGGDGSETADAMLALLDGGPFFFLLPETLNAARAALLAPEAEGKTVKENKKLLKTVSYAARTSYTLPADEVQNTLDRWLASLPDASRGAFPQALVFRGGTVKQVEYCDRNGTPVGGSWTFQADSGEGPRQISLTWAFTQTDGGTADLFEITTALPGGKDKRVITANIETGNIPGVRSITLDCRQSYTVSGKKCSESLYAELTTVTADRNERLFGEIRRTTQTGGDTEGFTLNPNIVALDYGDRLRLNGSLRVRILENENLKLDAQIDFNWGEAEREPDALPHDVTLLAADAMTEIAYAALMEEAVHTAVGHITRAVLTLPKESLTLISQFLSEGELDAIISDMQAREQAP